MVARDSSVHTPASGERRGWSHELKLAGRVVHFMHRAVGVVRLVFRC